MHVCDRNIVRTESMPINQNRIIIQNGEKVIKQIKQRKTNLRYQFVADAMNYSLESIKSYPKHLTKCNFHKTVLKCT